MQSKRTLIRLVGMVLLIICSMLSVQAQKDTTRFKKYIVDKTKKNPKKPEAIAPAMIPSDGCIISGPDVVTEGTTIYEYFLYCNDRYTADYWEIDCGIVEAWYSNAIYIRWTNAPGCSNAVIRAWYGDILLATKTITIQSSVLSGGSIDNPSQTIVYNTTPAQLNTVLASGGNCNGYYDYQWQRSTDNIYFTDINGATTPQYQPGPLTTTSYFRRKVTCNGAEAYTSNTATITVTRNVLNPGCITTREQVVRYNTNPAPIYASLVSGGHCSGNYQYQWQSSTDNTHFSDIAGATSQDLTFNSSLPQTTYFQRKVTCGTQISYTNTVRVTMTSSNVYYNVQKSGTFVRNNCVDGGTGNSVTYTVTADTYYSIISQDDADAKAQNEVNTNGQKYANDNGSCTWSSAQRIATFTRNNCIDGGVGSAVTYTVPAGRYTSTVSKADADAKAQNEINQNGQSYANDNGSCTWYNDAVNGYFYSQNCPSGQSPNPYYVSVPANTYSSTVSKIDAYYKAAEYAQSQANQYGTCTPPCSSNTCSGFDKKCINNVCEQGIRVVTSSYYEEDTGYYVCTYHYQWSDGSWSASRTEYGWGGCY